MSRPIGLGKVASNGTLNENGAFYSVQDVNVLLKNVSGGGGVDLPTPTIADAGSVVVVDEEGKYSLGEAGGGGLIVNITFEDNVTTATYTMDKSYSEIKTAILLGIMPIFIQYDIEVYINYQLQSLGDGDDLNPYTVMVYNYDHDAVDPLYSIVFTCDTETGVLTATISDGGDSI